MVQARSVAVRGTRLVRDYAASGKSFGVVTFLSAWAFGVAVFFRYQIAGHFTRTLGDRFDSVIETSILEHWYNVWRGLEGFRQMAFFYPVPDALGYNDAYFGYGLLYAPLRWVGFNPFLASEGVNVLIVAAGFPSMYVCACVAFGLRPAYAIFAGLLFTLSPNVYLQAGHEQLLSVMFAPLLFTLLCLFVRALVQRARRRALAWGALAAAMHALWLITAFYMAWFVCFNLLFVALALVCMAPRTIGIAWKIVRYDFVLLACLLGLYFVFNVPFATIYAPKLRETGQHTLAESMKGVPTYTDAANTGRGTLLFPDAKAWSGDEGPSAFEGERISGFAPSALVMFLAGCLLALYDRIRAGEQSGVLLPAVALAALGSWACILSFGGVTLWPAIHAVLPGAKAIRVIARYQIYLSFPVSLVCASALQRLSPYAPFGVRAGVAAIALAGQVTIDPNTALPAKAEAERLAALPLPPQQCKAFFVSRSRDGDYSRDWIDGIYNHNIEAMMFAEYRHIPTINGWDTFTPPDWHLVHPLDHVTYMAQVNGYAQIYNVSGLCSLDLATRRWENWTPGPPVDLLQPRLPPPDLHAASCLGWYDSQRVSTLLGPAAADLQGWVTVDAKQPNPPDAIAFRRHVAGEPDQIFATLRVSRPDVALALDNAALLRSGYQAFIPLPANGRHASVTPVLTYGQDTLECANLRQALHD